MGKGMRAGKKPSAGGGSMQKQLQQMQAMPVSYTHLDVYKRQEEMDR